MAHDKLFDAWPSPHALFAGRGRPSVFDRLRLLVACVFVLGSALAIAAGGFFAHTAATEAYDRLLISAAVQISETLTIEDDRLTVAPPDAAFETLALAPDDRLFYAVISPDGTVLTGYSTLAQIASNARDQPQIADAHFAGASVRAVTVGRYISSPEGGWSRVIVAQTRQARKVMAWTLMAKMASLVLFVGVLGYFAALAAARRALRPLSRIETALAGRDVHDVTPLEVDSPRETQALVDAINAVMARITDRMAKLHTFVAVAAHQIRTPLAALTSQLELLDGEGDANMRRTRIERLRGRVAELGRLTNQLLGHAMIVYRTDTVRHEMVDLAELARLAFHDAIPLSLDRDLTTLFDAPEEPVLVRGDPIGLREGLTNLINNAVVHGAPNRLEVHVGQNATEAWVVVADDGPGVAPEQWQAALTPFALARTERSGAGLGLSIVHEVARSHGGQVTFQSPAEGGFEVRLTLLIRTVRGALA